MSTVVSGNDQAEGLRNIFGAELCRVICIASTLDADSTIHLGHGTAQSLKQHNNHVLLVDEIPLAQRKTMSGFLYPTRYDLGQVFNNAVPLSRSIRQIDEYLWYATSTKLRSEVEHRFAKYPQLDVRLVQEEMGIDYVIFPTIDPQAQIVAFYGSNIQRILVTAGDQASLSKALVMLRQMAISWQSPASTIPGAGMPGTMVSICWPGLHRRGRRSGWNGCSWSQQRKQGGPALPI